MFNNILPELLTAIFEHLPYQSLKQALLVSRLVVIIIPNQNKSNSKSFLTKLLLTGSGGQLGKLLNCGRSFPSSSGQASTRTTSPCWTRCSPSEGSTPLNAFTLTWTFASNTTLPSQQSSTHLHNKLQSLSENFSWTWDSSAFKGMHNLSTIISSFLTLSWTKIVNWSVSFKTSVSHPTMSQTIESW